MGLSVKSVEEAVTILRNHIASRDWWIFVTDDMLSEAGRLLNRVENRHYAGEANADFEVLIAPEQVVNLVYRKDTARNEAARFPQLFFFFAKKTRMSAKQLWRIVRDNLPGTSAKDLETRDSLALLTDTSFADQLVRFLDMVQAEGTTIEESVPPSDN